MDVIGLIVERTRTTEPDTMNRPNISFANGVGPPLAGEVDNSPTQHIAADKAPGVDPVTGGTWVVVGAMTRNKMRRNRRPLAVCYLTDVSNQCQIIGPVGSEQVNVIET